MIYWYAKKHRSILRYIVLVCFPIISIAQSSVGIMGGPIYYKLEQNKTAVPNEVVGLKYSDSNLYKYMEVSIGLFHNTENFNENSTNTFYNGLYKFSYLNAVFSVQGNYLNKSTIKVYQTIGLGFGFLISKSIPNDRVVNGVDLNHDYSVVPLHLQLSIGGLYKFSKNIAFSIEPYLRYKVLNDPKYDTNSIYSYGALLGISYIITKGN